MPNRTYSFSVKAVDRAGNHSGSSNTVIVTTPPEEGAEAGAVLTLSYLKPTRIGVTWTSSTDDFSQVFHTLLVDGALYAGGMIGMRAANVLESHRSRPTCSR
jgi:endoglucanase